MSRVKHVVKPLRRSKKLLTTSSVLAQLDIAKSFNIYCDASCTGSGCVFMQEGRVILYSL
jgi:hypothetical protein